MKEMRKETEVVRVCKGDAFEYFKTFAGKSHVKQILVSHESESASPKWRTVVFLMFSITPVVFLLQDLKPHAV